MTPEEALKALVRAYQHLLFAHQQLRGVSPWQGFRESNNHLASGALDELIEADSLLRSACAALGAPQPRGVLVSPFGDSNFYLRGAELFDWLSVGSTLKELEALIDAVVDTHALHRDRTTPPAPPMEVEPLPDVHLSRLFARLAIAASMAGGLVMFFNER